MDKKSITFKIVSFILPKVNWGLLDTFFAMNIETAIIIFYGLKYSNLSIFEGRMNILVCALALLGFTCYILFGFFRITICKYYIW